MAVDLVGLQEPGQLDPAADMVIRAPGLLEDDEVLWAGVVGGDGQAARAAQRLNRIREHPVHAGPADARAPARVQEVGWDDDGSNPIGTIGVDTCGFPLLSVSAMR